MDIGSLICILSFYGVESVPTNKIGHSDTVALMAQLKIQFTKAEFMGVNHTHVQTANKQFPYTSLIFYRQITISCCKKRIYLL